MSKLVSSKWVLLVLAAVSGCSASDDTSSRRGSMGSDPAGSPSLGIGSGGRGAPSLTPGPGTGAAAGLAPVVPTQKPTMLDPNTCASASVRAERVKPTVYLVIDGSSSMNERFGGQGSRWQVLREAFVGANGVVTKLESVVTFGMSIYSNNDPMKCPAMVNVDPALKNFMAISGAYPAVETGGGTPTGEALQKVVDALPDFTMVGPDSMATVPPIIVLATDGEPNGCAAGAICNWIDWANCLGQLLGTLANAAPTYDTTLAAVRAAKAKGIAVWVVSLADGLNNIPDLQRTANIGAGLPDDANPGATIYSPQNPDELVGTLTKLIGDVVSCEVALEGAILPDRACEGTVEMNGQALECDKENGWKQIDSSRIEILGTACERLKSDPSILLDARFPCDVVRPI